MPNDCWCQRPCAHATTGVKGARADPGCPAPWSLSIGVSRYRWPPSDSTCKSTPSPDGGALSLWLPPSLAEVACDSRSWTLSLPEVRHPPIRDEPERDRHQLAIPRRTANRLMAFPTPLLPRCTARPSASRLPTRERLFSSSCYGADFRLADIRASGLGCAGPMRRNVFWSV